MDLMGFVREWLNEKKSKGFHVTLFRLRFGPGKGNIVDQIIWKKKKDK